jgi:RNA polymerase sigma factor (sigma-70 family)
MTDHKLQSHQLLNNRTPLIQLSCETTHSPILGSVLSRSIVQPYDFSEVEGFDAIPIQRIFTALPPALLRTMGRILLHLETTVIRAGHRGPLDFALNDFLDLFTDVPLGEGRIVVFRAVNIWYRTIYLQHLYWEKQWRDLYEDDTPLTKQQEAIFFQSMRTGSSIYSRERWRLLFSHRNEPLVSHIAKWYVGRRLCTKYDHRGNREEEWGALLEAGRRGKNKAIDKFDPSRGYKFSTYAWPWIKGEMTALFKNNPLKREIPFINLPRVDDDGHPIPFDEQITEDVFQFQAKATLTPHLPEDYLELNIAVGQALERLGDPRKSQIIISHHGLFGTEEQKLRVIAESLDITPQRVHAILKRSLAQLKEDHELRRFWKLWQHPRRWAEHCDLRDLGIKVK